MKLSRADREVFGVGTIAFALLAMVLAFAALVTAGQAYSRSNDAKRRLAKLEAGAVVVNAMKVGLQEFSISASPTIVKSGAVSLDVSNVGSITHELVIVRTPSVADLPSVKKAGERAVGDVDEEAIPEADKAGEAGDVPAGKHVTKSFDLSPGSYVMFCNIDIQNPDGTVTNHFQSGMRAAITVT